MGHFYLDVRFMICIWAIPNRFETVQYSTNPAGIHANKTVNITGIHFITRWVWAMASLFVAVARCDAVCNLVCHHIVAPINIGKIKYGSIAAKSEIHRNPALRIWTDTNNALYNAKKIGI